jgi:hypothetical protein
MPSCPICGTADMACMSAPYAAARRREEDAAKAADAAKRVKRYPAPAATLETPSEEVRIVGGLPVPPTFVGRRRRHQTGEVRTDR